MRVVMLVLNDMTGDARVDREASALAATGHEVTVLCLRSPDTQPSEARNGYRIARVAEPTTASWMSPLAKARQLKERSRALVSAAADCSPDVVHAHDLDTLAAAHEVAERTGATLVFDAHELYSEMLKEHGMRGSWPVQTYWKRLENTLIPATPNAITVSDALAAEMKQRWGVDPVVLRNVPPVQPLERTRLIRDEHGIANDLAVVLYQGVLVRGRGLHNLVAAVAKVDGVVLVLQGGGAEADSLQDQVRALGLEKKVMLAGWKPPETLHSYACGADVGVLSYEPTTLNNRLAAPNKLWAYLMAGLPVAASDSEGMREIVGAHELGELFDPRDPESIAGALKRLLDDPVARSEMGVRARHLAETRYNWDIEKRKLLDLYELIATERAANR